MPDPDAFTPRKHSHDLADAAPGMEDLGNHAYDLKDLERDLFAGAARRRAIARTLSRLDSRETPHLAEHLAWLLSCETDALTAYELYRAVKAVHPSGWQLSGWQCDLARATPFPVVRRAILADLLDEAFLDAEDEADRGLIDLLDDACPEDRALKLEFDVVSDDDARRHRARILGMLRPEAAMAEKTAALHVVNFMSGDVFDAVTSEALRALFMTDPHPAIGLRIARILSQRASGPCDADLLAFYVDAYHQRGVAAAAEGMEVLLYPVSGFLRDDLNARDPDPDEFAAVLLARFSEDHPAGGGDAVARAIAGLARDRSRPMAALSATAWLSRARGDCGEADDLAMEFARDEVHPEARALAIRVLGRQSGALAPLLDDLRLLATAPNTPETLRRAVFHVLTDARRAGLRIRREEVVDLYLAYLLLPGYENFAHALVGYDVTPVAGHYVARLAEVFDRIPDESARLSAMSLVEAPFDWGFDPAFEPWRTQTTDLMLASLDRPEEGELHRQVFWKMLHTVVLPEPHRSRFAAGLRDRLARLDYPEATLAHVEGWLHRMEATDGDAAP